MIINGKNINVFNATLVDRELTNHEVMNINNWLDGASSPVFLREYTRYKDVSLSLIFIGTNEQEIIGNIDKFVVELKNSTIKFDNLDFFFDTHLEGQIDMRKLNSHTYEVAAKLLAHRTYLAEVSYEFNRTVNATLTLEGTLETPVKIIIQPTAAIPSYTISGLSEDPIILKNLELGHTYTIDSYTTRYLKAGANDIGNYDSFEFPKGQPGANNIQFSSTAANVMIKAFPQFN